MNQTVTVTRIKAQTEITTIGAQANEVIYLVTDRFGLFALVRYQQWSRGWACSCGGKTCRHKLAVNTFLTEEMITRQRLAAQVTEAEIDTFQSQTGNEPGHASGHLKTRPLSREWSQLKGTAL